MSKTEYVYYCTECNNAQTNNSKCSKCGEDIAQIGWFCYLEESLEESHTI